MDYKTEYLKYKLKYNYLKNKIQTGGIRQINKKIITYMDTPQQDSDIGSEVILLENYKNHLVVILFKNRLTEKYEGGFDFRNNSENLKETAIRGLKHRSKNLIILNSNSIDDNYATRFGNFVGYLIYISCHDGKPLEENLFIQNKQALNEFTTPAAFLISDDLARISISQLISDNINLTCCDLTTSTIDHKPISISAKTVGLMRIALESGFLSVDNISVKSIKLNKKKYDNKKFEWFAKQLVSYLP